MLLYKPGQEVHGVGFRGSIRGEGGGRDLGMIGAGGYDAAAAEAAHEQVLDDYVLGLVVAWKLLPEREPPDVE